MTTLREIADEAGVSQVTVSKVLNGRIKEAWPKTARQAKRIRAIAERLGYQPHTAARAMVSGKFGCVGLLLSTERYRSSIPPALLTGIDEALSQRDIHLTLARLPDEKLTSEGFLPKILRQWLCDGLLINYHSSIPAQMLQIIRRYRVPSVWINVMQEHDAVYPDDCAAGRQATRMLLESGHRRIIYADSAFEVSKAAGTLHYSRPARFEGYCQAMAQAGLPAQMVSDPQTQAVGFMRRMRQLLMQPERPTAVISYQDGDIALTREIAAELNLRVPEDLSVISFRDEATLYDGIHRTSSMIVPESRLGQLAVEMLMAKIAAPRTTVASVAVPFGYQDKQSIRIPALAG